MARVKVCKPSASTIGHHWRDGKCLKCGLSWAKRKPARACKHEHLVFEDEAALPSNISIKCDACESIWTAELVSNTNRPMKNTLEVVRYDKRTPAGYVTRQGPSKI